MKGTFADDLPYGIFCWVDNVDMDMALLSPATLQKVNCWLNFSGPGQNCVESW